MTTPTASAPAPAVHKPVCWPDDDDWHRAHTKVELPSEKILRAFWHAEILDVDSTDQHDKIIEVQDPFVVRLRVELEGRLWKCIFGNWCFNVGFAPIGDGPRFNLSDRLPDPQVLQLRDWKGCDGLCVERCVTVPAGTIPTESCGIVYEIAAWWELRCCGYCEEKDSHLAASGFERLGMYSFV